MTALHRLLARLRDPHALERAESATGIGRRDLLRGIAGMAGLAAAGPLAAEIVREAELAVRARSFGAGGWARVYLVDVAGRRIPQTGKPVRVTAADGGGFRFVGSWAISDLAHVAGVEYPVSREYRVGRFDRGDIMLGRGDTLSVTATFGGPSPV